MFTPQQIVKGIDPRLTYIKKFQQTPHVFLVSNGNNYLVLKAASKGAYPLESPYLMQFRLDHISVEERILKELSEVDGITHLIRTCESKTHIALLKEFCEGRPIGRLDANYADYCTLWKKIREIHSHGIAGLDIRRSNFIKNYSQREQSPIIVDFGVGFFREDIGRKSFAKYKENDLDKLECLFNV